MELQALININHKGKIYKPGEIFHIDRKYITKINKYVNVINKNNNTDNISYKEDESKEKIIPYDKITTDKIKAKLEEKGISFNTNNKKELYELLYPNVNE